MQLPQTATNLVQIPEPQRVVFHVDMNAYFASVEQACNPFLAGKPVAVVGNPNFNGSAILARSYEAKAKGVKTFSRLGEAKAVCPELIAVPIDHLKYYDINRKLADIMRSYTPLIEIYSIDEFFMDLTSYVGIHKVSPEIVAHEIKARIAKEIHPVLRCSVGIGPNKLLAKIGSNFQKPDGLTSIPWKDRHKYLDALELDDIWGIGRNCIPKLAQIGIFSTKSIRDLPVQVLKNMVGSYWTRLVQIADGAHYEKVNPARYEKPAKSMQHAHTLSDATTDLDIIRALLRKQSERLAFRLRKHKQLAGNVTLGIRPVNQKHYGWGYMPNFYTQGRIGFYSDHGYDIYKTAIRLLQTLPLQGVQIRLAVIGVDHLIQTEQQLLLDARDSEKTKVDQAIDTINKRFGEFTVRTGDILHEKSKEKKYSVERQNMTFHPD